MYFVLHQDRGQALPQRFEFIAFRPPAHLDTMQSPSRGTSSLRCNLRQVSPVFGR
jgi:hypothetical protein